MFCFLKVHYGVYIHTLLLTATNWISLIQHICTPNSPNMAAWFIALCLKVRCLSYPQFQVRRVPRWSWSNNKYAMYGYTFKIQLSQNKNIGGVIVASMKFAWIVIMVMWWFIHRQTELQISSHLTTWLLKFPSAATSTTLACSVLVRPPDRYCRRTAKYVKLILKILAGQNCCA